MSHSKNRGTKETKKPKQSKESLTTDLDNQPKRCYANVIPPHRTKTSIYRGSYRTFVSKRRYAKLYLEDDLGKAEQQAIGGIGSPSWWTSDRNERKNPSIRKRLDREKGLKHNHREHTWRSRSVWWKSVDPPKIGPEGSTVGVQSKEISKKYNRAKSKRIEY